jgi:hypothetical protein
MRDAVCLPKACCKSGQANTTAFEEDHEQPAASCKMFFRELKYFLLLLSEREGDECPLVPISNMESGEETLDMGQIQRNTAPPT